MKPASDNTRELVSTAFPTAHSGASNPMRPGDDKWIEKFNQFKLETEFGEGGEVKHKTYVWVPSSSERVWEISKWKEVREIGEGGFGRVVLQKRVEEGDRGGQLRAVKVLSRKFMPTAAKSQELLALVKVAQYDHLFVQFLGWYENTKETFLVMEYIEFGDLGSYLKHGWTRPQIQEITRQVLEGLEVLHGKQICHRDLKPENILMASLDPIWIKITDFGISKRVKGTLVKTWIGTTAYIAPEILGLLPGKIRIPYALDIWSLGIMVHQLVTSERPFTEAAYDDEPVSGVPEEEEPQIDTQALFNYCQGSIGFPVEELRQAQLDSRGIDFIKSLLVAKPEGRLTATSALKHPWLTADPYVSDSTQRIKTEFSCLGVDLFKGNENAIMRQVGSGDIVRFFTSSEQEKTLSLVREAVMNGYVSALDRLLASPKLRLSTLDAQAQRSLVEQAIETGQLGSLRVLLKGGAFDRVCVDSQLLLAVRFGQVEMVALLLKHAVISFTLLQLVVKQGELDIAHINLSKQSKILNVESRRTPLQDACEAGDINVVKFLLANDVNPNDGGNDGLIALQMAAWNGHLDLVKFLLDNKADIDQVGSEGQTALKAAAQGGHLDVVKFLLNNKAQVNDRARGNGGLTVLQAAVKRGNIHLAKLLLDDKADLNSRGIDGLTPVQVAARCGDYNVVKWMLDNRVDTERRASDGWTVLQATAGAGHIDVVKLLLKNNANVNAKAANGGRTALQAAAGGGHIEVVKLLLDNMRWEWGRDNNDEAAAFQGRTALQAAAEGGHIDVVKLLLDNKAQVNAPPAYEGRTALQAASGGGRIGVVKLLLYNDARINAKAATYLGRTALQAAAEGGHIDVVEFLLGDGAKVNAGASTFQGRTALQAAAEGGHIDVVKLLLDNKAEVNAKAAALGGRTALQAAAGGGHIDVVKLLLDNEARVNAPPSDEGRTALQAAAEDGHIDVVKLLLDNKAQVNAKAAQGGKTAIKAAADGGYVQIAEMLQSWGK